MHALSGTQGRLPVHTRVVDLDRLQVQVHAEVLADDGGEGDADSLDSPPRVRPGQPCVHAAPRQMEHVRGCGEIKTL